MSSDRSEHDSSILVDWKQLPSETLHNVIEDLVTRGEPDEMDIETRRHQLLQALKAGLTHLYFDPVEETIFLRNPELGKISSRRQDS